MKKNYFAPKCDIVNMQVVTNILETSGLPSDGGNATDIIPGGGIHDSEFNSNTNNGIW